MTTRRQIGSGNAGFTLLELMVSVLVSSIVLFGVFTIYNATITGYRVQDQSLQALGQLRVATQQLRADLRSAGFNAPSQSIEEDWVITRDTTTLSALAIDIDPTNPVIHPNSNKNIQPHRIRLFGDYIAHQSWRTLRIEGQNITLQTTPGQDTEADFNRVFKSGNVLRLELHGQARAEQYVAIREAQWNNGNGPMVTVSNNIQGILGFGEGHEVSVATFVRYRLQRDERRSDDSVKYDLIRERLDENGKPIAGSWLIVAEYVVDLQVYDICLNGTLPVELGTMAQDPPSVVCYDTLEALESGPFTLAPNSDNDAHLVRSVTVKISTRAPNEDENIPFMPRSQRDAPLRAFDLDPQMPGAARVHELATTTFMTSIQARRQ